MSAPRRLTVQQPAIQPNVAMARIGPNSFCAFASRAKMIVEEMLNVGDEQRAWSWIVASVSQGFQPSLMAVLARAMVAAVASDNPRSTLTGDACRSAIAPKISGETKAASAVVANA